MKQIVLSSEFLEQISSGKNVFDNIEIHYADLSGKTFENLKIRDSKFVFTSFRNCIFKNVIFENCEMFFVSSGSSDFKNVQFVRCQLDYSGFTGTMFTDTKMTDTRLSWTSLIDTNIGGLELSNCSEFMIIRNISELTSDIIQKAWTQLQPLLQQLDFDTREKIRYLIDTFMQKHKIQIPKPAASSSAYKEGGATSAGYRMFDVLIDSAISSYGQENMHKTSNVYETKSEYGR